MFDVLVIGAGHAGCEAAAAAARRGADQGRRRVGAKRGIRVAELGQDFFGERDQPLIGMDLAAVKANGSLARMLAPASEAPAGGQNAPAAPSALGSEVMLSSCFVGGWNCP